MNFHVRFGFLRGVVAGGLVACATARKALCHSHNYFQPNLKKQFFEKVVLDRELLKKEREETVYKKFPWMKDRVSRDELLAEIEGILKKFPRMCNPTERRILRTLVHDIIQRYKLHNKEIDAFLLLLRYYKAI